MRRLSSIFSFRTLQGPWPLPLAGLLAVGLVLSAEAGAQWLVARGSLQTDRSLHGLVRQALTILEKERPEVWFLGNSTLAAGVDGTIVSAAIDGHVALLPHGSATLRGLGAMLAFYLRHVDAKPRTVFLVVTNDDLNENGYRAEISRTYSAINDTDRVPRDPNWLMLRSARATLRGQLTFGSTVQGEYEATSTRSDTPHFDGEPIAPDDPWYSSLARDYALDESAFTLVADVRQRYQLGRVVVLLLPVTGALARFHDETHPDIGYAAISHRVAELCVASNLELVDWSEPSLQNELFRDAYHLNRNGKEWLSRRLAAWLAGDGAITRSDNP